MARKPWSTEFVKVFDKWKTPVRGKYSYYFSHNRHSIGADVLRDPGMEFDIEHKILYINYHITPNEELNEYDTVKKLRYKLHELGIRYDNMIVHTENLWTRGDTLKYSFKVYLKWNHLPEKEEINQFETIFRSFEK